MSRSWLAAAAVAATLIGAAAHAQSPERFTVSVAQAPAGGADQSWSQAVASAMMPGWYRRPGEGPFTFRSPLSSIYFIVGGHAGFGRDTTLEDANGCGATTFFINCTNARPSGGIGNGGGGSIGVGMRLTPALRVAALATVEGGYRFNNDTPWVQSGAGNFPGDRFFERIPIRSYQGSFNVYLDAAGLFAPGALGRWNPYVMAGVGIASNVTSDITETQQFAGGGTTTNTFPGATHTSFLWTGGIGVQYLLAMGAVVDLGYQYVDAGRFVANGGGAAETGLDPVRGDLRTHRIGLALNIDFNALSRLVSGR
jgi:opacity protein-like surface antigen